MLITFWRCAASSSSYSLQGLGLMTCLVPLTFEKSFGCYPWLHFPCGWYFVIKCGSLSQSIFRMCYIFLFSYCWIFCTAGLILSSDKISSLFLYSCHVWFAFLLINFISTDVILDLSCSLIAQDSHPYNKLDSAKVSYVFSLVCFWTGEGLTFLLIISVIWGNSNIFTVIYFFILAWNTAT